MFTELVRRSAVNMGQYLDASERYMRLALKAKANCPPTLEAQAKLHQRGGQTVKHVHLNEGGQAVVAAKMPQHKKKVVGDRLEAFGISGAGGRSEKP